MKQHKISVLGRAFCKYWDFDTRKISKRTLVRVGRTQEREVYEKNGQFYTYSALHNTFIPLNNQERAEYIQNKVTKNEK